MNERSPTTEPPPHVSLRDVAERTSVSFQTVSKVLKGQGRVAPVTRQRILDVAAELGYVPNTLARGLATRRTGSIGFIASGLASFVLAPLMHGAEREARAHGYFTIFTLAEGDEEHGERLVRQLVERRVDGIVNAALTLQDAQRYGELLRRLTPSVSIFPVQGGGVPLVGEDPALMGLIATRHLLSLGHRCIGTIVGPSVRRATNDRLRGHQQALEEHGIGPDPRLVEAGYWTAEGGYEAMTRLLERVPTPTAVFAHNDYMAIGAIRALHDRGLGVPEDCAIVGCDDIALAPYTIPALTTVRISFENNGAAAVRLLLDRIAKREPAPERLVLPVELVVRASCGHPSGRLP